MFFNTMFKNPPEAETKQANHRSHYPRQLVLVSRRRFSAERGLYFCVDTFEHKFVRPVSP